MPRLGLVIALLLFAGAVIALATLATCNGPDEHPDQHPDEVAPPRSVEPESSPAAPTKASPPTPQQHATRTRAPSEPQPIPAATQETSAAPGEPVDLRIRVLRPDGTPAAGATVDVSRVEKPKDGDLGSIVSSPSRSLIVTLTADAAGRTVAQVPRDTACVVSAHLREDIGESSRKPDADPTDVDVQLQPGMMVTGVVRELDGAPARDAKVAVSSWGEIRNVVAGPDGRFEAGPMPLRGRGIANSVDVRVERPDLYPARLFVNAGEPTRDLVLTLTPCVGLHGRVIDTDGKPVAQTWLLFHNGDVKDEQRVITDKKGYFTARMAPTARGDMTFIAHERVARRLPGVLLTAGDRDLGDVVVELGRTIDGVVLREDGTPAERPHVSVYSVVVGIVICEAHMGPGATFQGWRIGPGEHWLHVQDLPMSGVAGLWDETVVKGCVAGMEDVRVVVIDGPGVLVRLHVAGDAADAAPHAVPVVHATIRPRGDTTPRSIVDGRVTHTLRLAATPGTTCDVEVEAEGFSTWRAESVEVAAGRATVIDAFLVGAAPDKR